MHHKNVFVFLPLGGEDAVEDGALPAVSHRLQDKHVLDDVEGKAVIGEGTQELRLQEGGPFLLQHPLTTFITLQTGQKLQFVTEDFVSHCNIICTSWNKPRNVADDTERRVED